MIWNVERVPDLDGYTVEWAERGNYLLSRRNAIYRSADLQPPFELVAAIDAPGWKSLATVLRPVQRLLRFSVTNVLPVGNGELFVTFDKAIGVIRAGKYMALGGLTRECRVLRGACAVDRDGSVFFGEYLANDERGPMLVYRYRPGQESVETVYEFPAGSIKHVHGVYFDPYTESLVCLTGDNDSECRMLRTFDEFRTVEEIGAGDETWRAVSVLFSERALYYGTDAEFRSNVVYELSRTGGERKILGEVTGTVFYSKKVGEDLFFATTAENAPSQKENVAAIWSFGQDGILTEVAKFEKDWWHPTLFQFGTIQFPNFAEIGSELYFSLVGVEGDNRTFRLRRTV
ncbi:MAG: hypothetical protein IPN69_12370 [Acidobacteria bacterium]|nr:hypothetical protein [Acidobacteriota bacterium]